jgi:DNA polymerase
MAGCRKCGLAEGRTRVVPGEGPAGAKAMLIGEAPGKQEDATGRPFVGMTGERFLRPLLRELGLDPAGLFITSVAKCRPPNNRDPKPDEVAACVNAWLADQVRAVDPVEIMLLGKVPAKGLLGLTGTIASLRGREFLVFNRPARVTYHPTAGMRFPGPRQGLTEDLAALRHRLA